jgi:alpha,alpha-trehalase
MSTLERARRGDLPLSEYALIGDGVTTALVARDGSIDWLCYGRLDGPAVLCRLLDRERGGYFQVAPSLPFVARRRYVGRTNVLETELECASGKVRLTDFMPLGGGAAGSMVLRRIEGLAGWVPLLVDFAPTFDFARAPTSVEPCAGGCVARGGGQVLRLSCPEPMSARGQGVTAALEVHAGQTQWLALTHGAPPPDDAAAGGALQTTLEAWRRWSAEGTYSSRYEELLRRSALVLKLLVHRPTGAIVAAPTTSLPEEPGGARNWDYRYTWLRDASWLASALMSLGYHDESMAFLDWLEALDLPGTQPAVFYDLDGEVPAMEVELPHLRGYRGSTPVRVGNAAARQDQHDVFGEVVSAIHLCWSGMPSMRPLRPGLWRVVTALADMAAEHWEHEDRGMWEVRDRPRHFVSSKLLCWTALDCALAIAERDGLEGPLWRWRSERERSRDALLREGFDEEAGAFRRAFGEPGLDAATLLLPRYGFLPADDPRFARTVEVVRRRLRASEPHLLRRYLGPDGVPGSEGAFTACSFWLADALARQGRLDEARATFEAVAAHANDVGLLSEELAPETGELLGNFPQAFTHLALIRAATTIAEAEAGDEPGGV